MEREAPHRGMPEDTIGNIRDEKDRTPLIHGRQVSRLNL